MPRKFKTARLIKGLAVSDAIKLLGIPQSTLSDWETERKSPSLEKLELMAEVYGVSTDYLLGLAETSHAFSTRNLVAVENLPVLHGKPVWSPQYGWLLVNSTEQCFLQPDGNTVPFSDAGKLYMTPPAYSETQLPQETLASINDPENKQIIFMDLLCDIADLLGVGPKYFLEHQTQRIQNAKDNEDEPK